MPIVDEDGFFKVSYKGKKKKDVNKTVESVTSNNPTNFHSIIENVQNELKNCDFTSKFSEDFYEVLKEWDFDCNKIKADNDTQNHEICSQRQEIDILCYGLGQFSSCIIARYQLGFLLFLKQFLKSSNVFIFDPQFSVEEKEFLSGLKFDVLNVNEEAKRTVNSKTVCFMPHCDIPLYNNLLWANWNIKNLSSLAVIGNSFKSYEINDAKSQLKSKAKYVYLANRVVTEVKLNNCFRFNDIFNDLSIHYFSLSSLCDIEHHIWIDVNEPEYGEDDAINHC